MSDKTDFKVSDLVKITPFLYGNSDFSIGIIVEFESHGADPPRDDILGPWVVYNTSLFKKFHYTSDELERLSK